MRCDAGGRGFVGGGFCCGHSGQNGGHVLGLHVGGGWLGGAGCDLAVWRAGLVSSGGGGSSRAAVFAFWGWLGLGPAMREVMWVGVRGEKQFAWAAFRGGLGLDFLGCVLGACAGHWADWACRWASGPFGWVCAARRVRGMVRGVRRMGLL